MENRRLALTIPGTLIGLNEYTRANRTQAIAGANMKRIEERKIMHYIDLQLLHNLEEFVPIKKVYIFFRWIEPNKMRDPDNIAFAKKFILDALCTKGILTGDGWREIKGFNDDFEISKDRPRIEVIIQELDDEEDKNVASNKRKKSKKGENSAQV